MKGFGENSGAFSVFRNGISWAAAVYGGELRREEDGCFRSRVSGREEAIGRAPLDILRIP
ncbi:hypothetical protein B5E84_01330 [Lachnoclostridium sp. An14]|nr:hypothetical protein B5E84_01330 [Lachnoclostridium sp. An14]